MLACQHLHPLAFALPYRWAPRVCPGVRVVGDAAAPHRAGESAWAFLGAPLKTTPLTRALNPQKSACLLPGDVYRLNCRNLTLKTYCLARKNHKDNPLCPGLRARTLACLLKFVKDFLEGIGAARLWCNFPCIIEFPHISLSGTMLLLKFLARDGLYVPNCLVYFKGFGKYLKT